VTSEGYFTADSIGKLEKRKSSFTTLTHGKLEGVGLLLAPGEL